MAGFHPDSKFVATVAPSPNSEERKSGLRADMIILHYTGLADPQRALTLLCDPNSKLSCHYMVYEDGGVTQMVPEALRAWHAGVSSWEGETDINSRSIGIEIVNPGHGLGYPDFSAIQIAAVIDLCRDIIARRNVRPQHVLAHSDVAPSRKSDPGEKFPWQQLHAADVGLWIKPAPLTRGPTLMLGDRGDPVARLQRALAEYGYGIERSGHFDAVTRDVLVAFQRHFRPAQVDGIADVSTRETLKRLLAARKRIEGSVPSPAGEG
jgi:N-acetylmuramoyl-L-alanine amidase